MQTRQIRLWILAGALCGAIALAGCGSDAASAPSANSAGAPAAKLPASDSDKSSTDQPGKPKAPASVTGWGSIKGRFTYDGPSPVPEALKIDKDLEVCGNHDLKDEGLVVGPSGGIANIVVWVNSKVKINPKFDATKSDKVVLDNKNCHFVPHVVGLRTGQTLVIRNDDPIAHNTKIDGENTQVNPLIPAGATSEQPIDVAENLPAPVSCSIHGWMHALMVVRPNPYFAITDKDGNFEIDDCRRATWNSRFGKNERDMSPMRSSTGSPSNGQRAM